MKRRIKKSHSRRLVALGAALPLIGSSLQAAPAGPTPQLPDNGGAPGAFPNTSVSSINVIVRGSTAFNSSVDVPGIDGQGPIPWTLNRYNRGDFCLRLSPANPTAALTNLNKGFIEFADDAPEAAINQAWRPQPQLGVIIPTARQNGPIDWNDGEGPFFPTVAISQASSGRGYSMTDGSFGGGNLDINTGRAGTHESSPESNFSFSATWFPYDQGWIGGEFAGPDSLTGASRWTAPTSHSAGISPGFLKWNDLPAESGIFVGLGQLALPGINSLTGGMIFATSSDGNSDVNIVGLAPKEDGSGWVVTVREDSATDSETLAGPDQSEFQFVYVPYTAQNLIGGYIDGQNAGKLQSKGDFTIARTAAGTYELTIPGKTGSNGTLLLQVADFESGTSVPMASRAFLSYEFKDGKFVIQARKTTTDTTADLADVKFYFAWVDFQNPLAMPDGPRLRSLPVVTLTPEGITAKEAGIAINTDEPEVLVTAIDDGNTGGHIDPITGQPGIATLVGYFINPRTLEKIGEPFPIVGNPYGTFTRHDVKYNPVSKQYVVVANARGYGANEQSVVLMALINPSTAPETAPRIAKAFAHDAENSNTYDDVAVGVSSKNGNIILVAEYQFAEDGNTSEDTIGVLFDKDGTILTPTPGRLDLLQPLGDEDDPDVTYLEKQDAFLYIANTDVSGGLGNRVVGSIIQTVPGQNGTLQTQTEKILGDGVPAGTAEGHPSSFENPFNGELLTAFDLGGNGVPNGAISFYNIGPAPAYAFTSARPESLYLSASEPVLVRHNHPQFAADLNSGVIAIGHNARQSDAGYPDGYAFTLYDKNGSPLPSPFGAPYYLADAIGSIDQGPNLHNIKYSPVSDSFLVAFTTATAPGVTYITGFQVTSDHLGGGNGETPSLAISSTGTGLEIVWPNSATGYVLESSNAIQPAAWTAVGTAPTPVGNNLKVTVAPEGTAKFYRLRR